MKRSIVLIGIMVLALSLIACGNASSSNEVEVNNTTENVANENVTPSEETTDAVASEEETEDTSEEELAVGKRVPNYELTTLEGETVSLHDYDGKIILLNFWATW